MTTAALSTLPRRRFSSLVVGLLMACLACSSGCAALSNPVFDAIPSRRVPHEYLASPREELKTIPLTALSQVQPEAYRVNKDDILGVFIEGIMGEKGQPLPILYPDQARSSSNLPPAVGYPIPVASDGTLPLPFIEPLKVEKLTLKEIETLVRDTYIEKKILKADARNNTRIYISLLRPRTTRVLVFRQETAPGSIGAGGISGSKRGTGQTIDLPAFENDVLSALARSGGLPGLDSLNEVFIERTLPSGEIKVIRIPLRMRPGAELPFDPKDVILENGDVVFIEARDTEFYYVGGLTQPRQFTLPRDYDVRVTEAVAIAGGPLVNGGVNTNNLSGSLIAAGIGSPSPSSVTVLRRTKNNGQMKIAVNLNRALNNRNENIILQSGDMMIVQETPGEAFTRYITNAIRFNPVGTLIRQRDFVAPVTGSFP